MSLGYTGKYNADTKLGEAPQPGTKMSLEEVRLRYPDIMPQLWKTLCAYERSMSFYLQGKPKDKAKAQRQLRRIKRADKHLKKTQNHHAWQEQWQQHEKDTEKL